MKNRSSFSSLRLIFFFVCFFTAETRQTWWTSTIDFKLIGHRSAPGLTPPTHSWASGPWGGAAGRKEKGKEAVGIRLWTPESERRWETIAGLRSGFSLTRITPSETPELLPESLIIVLHKFVWNFFSPPRLGVSSLQPNSSSFLLILRWVKEGSNHQRESVKASWRSWTVPSPFCTGTGTSASSPRPRRSIPCSTPM